MGNEHEPGSGTGVEAADRETGPAVKPPEPEMIGWKTAEEFAIKPRADTAVICLDPAGTIMAAVGDRRKRASVRTGRFELGTTIWAWAPPASRIIRPGQGLDLLEFAREWYECDADVYAHMATLLLGLGGENYEPKTHVGWDAHSLTTALLEHFVPRRAEKNPFTAILHLAVASDADFLADLARIAAVHPPESRISLWLSGWRREDAAVRREVRSLLRPAFAWAANANLLAMIGAEPADQPDPLPCTDIWVHLPRSDMVHNPAFLRFLTGMLAYICARMRRPRTVVVPKLAMDDWKALFAQLGIAPWEEKQKRDAPEKVGPDDLGPMHGPGARRMAEPED